MKQRIIRKGAALLAAALFFTGSMPVHLQASAQTKQEDRFGAAALSGEEIVDSLLLPYYMSERDALPMTFGDARIRWTSDHECIDAATGRITAPEQVQAEVNLEAEITLADGSTRKKAFSVQVLPKNCGYILGYTRENDDSIKRNGKEHGMYQSAVTDSLHLGYSSDGKHFEPLNYNTGVLFAKNEGNKTKVLRQPYIFRMKDGSFGVVAVRANEAEETDDQKGAVLFFTSKDLISYKEMKMLSLSDSDTVKDPACVYDKVSDQYYITWTSEETGIRNMSQTADFESVLPKGELEVQEPQTMESGIPYAIESNVIAVTAEEAERIVKKLKPVVNTTVDDAQIKTEPGKPVDLSAVKVTANYSDGSKAEKSVSWNTDEIQKVDFDKEGVYEVTGEIRQLSDKIGGDGNYPFIPGRADPNVVKYRDKYYFIATNESGNVNLFIRESDTVAGLNEVEEHLVYDEAKGAEGNIVSTSNHWAPELHVIGDELYMFFSTNIGTGWDVQSVIMKLKTGGDPKKYEDWEAPKRYLDQDGKVLNTYYGGITLDMTHFSYGGRHYVVWSQRNFGKNAGTADLWIGETTAENPGQLISAPVLIVPCEYSWERNHQNVTEGPFVIITEDKLYLTYSGGATDETYCVGLTQIDLSDDVDFLNPESWTKSNYPILTGLSSQGENKYHGPGHNSYITDEDGNLVNVFHARPGDGNAFQRDAFLRIVHFGADGAPVLDMKETSEILPENKQVKMIVSVQAAKPEEPTQSPSAGGSPSTPAPGQNAPSGQTSGQPAAVSPAPQPKDTITNGQMYTSGGMKYKVTGKDTVQFVKPLKQKQAKISVPASVTISGRSFRVTEIAAKACYNNKNLKQVVIGKNVIRIGTKAFANCKNLRSIQIKSSGLTKIGSHAFRNINKKAVVKVPAKKKSSYNKLLKGKIRKNI